MIFPSKPTKQPTRNPMKTTHSFHKFRLLAPGAMFALLAALGVPSTEAHLTYPATRNFGTFDGSSAQSVSITGQSSRANGWADGADANWAPQDNQRYFQFTLLSATTINVSVMSLVPATFFPALSVYSGLGHAATDSAHPDFDGSTTTQAYLAALGAPTRSGAFNALGDLTIGNDDDAANNYVGSLIKLLYQGSAADGTASNYGSAAGINGDGHLDGLLTASLNLPAGVYTMAISGADYNNPSTTAYGFNTTVSTVPEPGVTSLLGVTALAFGLLRRKRAE